MRNNHPKQQLHTISKVETISESNAIRQAFLTIQIVTTKKTQPAILQLYISSNHRNNIFILNKLFVPLK